MDTFNFLRREKGQAPGVDRLRFNDLSRSEVAAALRQVRELIPQGKYHPLPQRTCLIPKPNHGVRELQLQAVVDRIISAAVASKTSPLCEAAFCGNNFGFRRARGVLGLLARLETMLRRHGYFYVVEVDVKDAFPSTSSAAALEELRALPIESSVIDLIRTIFNSETEVSGPRGLPQGNPLSPQLFNLVLTRLLDRPLETDSRDALLLRYADNLVLAARQITDVRSAQGRVAELLATAGYELKKPLAEPCDVREPKNEIQILGYGAAYSQDRLTLKSNPKSWSQLTGMFQEARKSTHPAITATALVRGWLGSQGPTVEGANRSAWITRVREAAADHGFRELGRTEDLIQSLVRGNDHWESIRLKESGGAPSCLIKNQGLRTHERRLDDASDGGRNSHFRPPF